MGIIQRVVKPRNQRSKRALESREPKAIENDKSTIFVKGRKCSETVRSCMRDFCSLKRPNSLMFNQKNDIFPFEDATKLEFFCKKTDSSLFAFGNSSKKRPDNLVIGRLFDQHILDMIELGIVQFKALDEFLNEKVAMATKPCLLFSGPIFEHDPEMMRIKSIMIDFFRGPVVTHVRLAGLEHAIQFTGFEIEGKKFILLRSYKVTLKKSSSGRLPRLEMEEIGPRVDFQVRRLHLASEDHFKDACKQVKNLHKKKKVKNVSQDGFGSTLGRVHVPAQNIGTIQTRKMKGLKESEQEKKVKKLILMKEKREKAEEARKANVDKIFAEEMAAEQAQ